LNGISIIKVYPTQILSARKYLKQLKKKEKMELNKKIILRANKLWL
jgi:hypothetical protein